MRRLQAEWPRLTDTEREAVSMYLLSEPCTDRRRSRVLDWSRLAVIRLRQLRRRMDDGRVWGAGGGVWPCPEEVDFFRACGLPWVEPRDRR